MTDSGTDDTGTRSPEQAPERDTADEVDRASHLTRVLGWVLDPRPPATAGPRLVWWASWACAALSALYIAWTVPTLLGVVAAVALPLLVRRLPMSGIVLVAVLAQEIKPNGRFGELTTLGYPAFISPGKAPIILPLAVTAVLAAAARWWPPARPQLRSVGPALLGPAVGLIVLAVGSGLFHGQSAFSAVNQNARPFVLLVLGLFIGMSFRWLRDDQRVTGATVWAALVGLLVAAAVAIPLGEAADDRLSAYFIYYDSALPAIAAAVFIGMLGDNGWRWDWRHMVLAASTPLLILISFRRSVWVAALVALVVVLVLTWRRWQRMIRQFGFAALVVAVVVLAAPGFAADLGLRSAGSFDLASGAPSPSAKPSVSGPPSVSAKPSASGPPSVSAKPSASGQPSRGVSPTATGKPRAAGTPSVTGSPRPAGGVSASGSPSRSANASTTPSRPAQTPPAQASAQHQAASTSGHLSDLRLGWNYVRANLWTGVGPLAPQLPGLAANNSERVYVHNELLQDWLRYGPLAPLLVILFLAAAALAALKAIRDPGSDVVVRSAAAFCLIAPLCLMTAPFLSETSRWPLVLGIAAGIVVPIFLGRGQREGQPSE
ncbi:hypothetical protein [Micromonospora sp. NPDC005237]|uniref:hypothetical protein n=1 Tax=Micromonospora sp. NPDC005237 TaxID=3155113 RepID=UPI0033B16CD0